MRKSRPDNVEHADGIWHERAIQSGYKNEREMFDGFVAEGLTLTDMANKFHNPRTKRQLCQEAVGRRIRAKHSHLRVGRQGWIDRKPPSKYEGCEMLSRPTHGAIYRGADQVNPYPVGGMSGLPAYQGI